METQLNTPKWQAKYNTIYPPEIVNKITPKTDLPNSSAKAGKINTWVAFGLLFILGVAVYLLVDQNVKKEKIQ